MSRNKFLTPDSLEGESLCYQINIPVRLFEFVLGALLPLGETWQWEKEGDVEPADAAEYFSEWIYGLLDTECIEPMPIIRFFGSRTSNQSIAHQTETTFDIASTVHTAASFTYTAGVETIELLADGFYSMYFATAFSAHATGDRYFGIKDVNTGEWYCLSLNRATANTNWGQTASTFRFFTAGTVVYPRVWQNSGGSLNLFASSTQKSWMAIVYHGNN